MYLYALTLAALVVSANSMNSKSDMDSTSDFSSNSQSGDTSTQDGGQSMAGKCKEVKFPSDIPSSYRTQYCGMQGCLHLASASEEHCVEKGTTTTSSTTTPGCAQTDGISANSADCTCGSSTSSTGVKTCTGVTGLFCTAATSTCAFQAKQKTSSTCASGKMKSSDGTCVDCSPGKFSETGDASCSSCPTNKYQDQVGQSSCKNCPSGKVAPQIGSTSYSDAGAEIWWRVLFFFSGCCSAPFYCPRVSVSVKCVKRKTFNYYFQWVCKCRD